MKLRNEETRIYIISGKARAGKDTTGTYIKEHFESEEKKVITLGFADYIKMYAKKISDWDGNDETKPRSLLQELGTEIIRNRIDEYFFINRMIEDIKVYSYFFDIIIITDARLSKEILSIKDNFKDVTSINIERPNLKTQLTTKEQEHITETGLDNFNDYDFIINNDGTLEDLRKKVDKLI